MSNNKIEEIIDKIKKNYKENNLEIVKELLNSLIEIENKNPKPYTHYLIALFHLKKEDYHLAIPHLIRVINSDRYASFFPKVNKLLAYSYLKKSEFWEAREILEELMEDYYTDIQIKNMYAYTLFSLKDFKEALTLYKEILNEDIDNITAQNGMICTYLEQENIKEIKNHLHTLEPYSQSEDPRILDTLGWVYFQLGNHEKSYLYLQKAYDKVPNNPDINRHFSILRNATIH